jgi:CheY-like chemotaxis protein
MSAKRILIAEDRLDHRKVMKDLLVSEGYDVILAENSLGAEEILRNDTNIDLIVLDFALLPVNGVQLLKKIRSFIPLKNHWQTPVIFVTAHPENEELVDVKNKKIPVLSKPFRHYQDFLDAVKNQLANRSPRRGGR